eukprot:jgi/Psemu1/310876/fgenesh1_kg.691_\
MHMHYSPHGPFPRRPPMHHNHHPVDPRHHHHQQQQHHHGGRGSSFRSVVYSYRDESAATAAPFGNDNDTDRHRPPVDPRVNDRGGSGKDGGNEEHLPKPTTMSYANTNTNIVGANPPAPRDDYGYGYGNDANGNPDSNPTNDCDKNKNCTRCTSTHHHHDNDIDPYHSRIVRDIRLLERHYFNAEQRRMQQQHAAPHGRWYH